MGMPVRGNHKEETENCIGFPFTQNTAGFLRNLNIQIHTQAIPLLQICMWICVCKKDSTYRYIDTGLSMHRPFKSSQTPAAGDVVKGLITAAFMQSKLG